MDQIYTIIAIIKLRDTFELESELDHRLLNY